MKRTLEQSKSFFNIRHTDKRGFNRELYFTPISVIDKIVFSLLLVFPWLREMVWIDPCAGDGRWGEVFKKYGIECYSYDITPLSPEVKQQDFLTAERSLYTQKPIFFIGNPPFSLLKQFINKALSLTHYCYFLGGSQLITGTLSPQVVLLHRFEGFEGNQKDLRSKIVFNDTLGKDVLVWCCGGMFFSHGKDDFKLQRSTFKDKDNFRVGIKTYCYPDERVHTILK